MPIYEYRCGACGSRHEVLQKMSEAPLTDCPACGEAALTKLVSAAGFQLKGSGWYATDFKNGSKSASKEGETVDSKSKADSAESKVNGDQDKARSTGDVGESKAKETAKSDVPRGTSATPASH